MANMVGVLCAVATLASAGSASAAGPVVSTARKSDQATVGRSMSKADERKHDELFKRGADLISPYMRLTDRPRRKATDARDLREGIRLLDEALKLFPGNWSALWIQGKAFQALDEHAQAYARFKRAYALQRDNPDVGREFMFECLEVGHVDEAVEAAGAAASRAPRDAGVRANLALALLLAGRVDEAEANASQAQLMDPDDKITKSLIRVIGEVRSGKRPRPHHISDLQK
jgi:tetratricopeptide (TPR) repeat protein